MVFRDRTALAESRRFSVSEWDGAPVEELTADASATSSSSGGDAADTDTRGEVGDDAAAAPSTAGAAAAPVMDLGSVYSAIRPTREQARDHNTHEASSDSYDERQAQVSGPRAPHKAASRRGSWFHSKRRSDADDATVAPSSSASRTSYSSSSGTNIWSKLLGGNGEGLWDGLDGKDAFDDADSLLGDEDPSVPPGCMEETRRGLRRRGLGAWYEIKHWCKTIYEHPHIALASLATFGILLGVGLAAINAERGVYVRKQQMTVEFIARETAEWFQNEFRKAMLPLYSVQQAVKHSGYFNDLADKIGDYPRFAVPATDYLADPTLEDVPKGRIYRNLTGICDDPTMQQRFRDIVQPVNEENGLDDGTVFAYRLAPRNTFCLFERDDPDMPDKNFGFDASVSSRSKFWVKVTKDIFGIQDDTPPEESGEVSPPFTMPGMSSDQAYSIYGPFGMPDKEWICGHLPIYTRAQDPQGKPLNVHGVNVEGGWGFVMNFLDWRQLKDRSNIYERFAGCNVEFDLRRKDDGAWLASSPRAELLNDENSILVETESLHGVWQNRVGRVDGWSPAWYNAALAGVILGSLVLGFLVASTLVERQLHRDLVRKMLPRRAIAKLHRGQTVLERYNLVTIFFSDIVGFTSMAGQMRPIQVMSMLNQLYTELDKLVEKHQVYKVETIGDAYMVVGGAPDRVPAPLAAERVALFALDAIEFVRNFRTKDGDQVFIRAGLASGPTVAGVVGETTRPADTFRAWKAEKLKQKYPLMQLECDYVIAFVKKLPSNLLFLPVFPVYICLLRCRVPDYRDEHDASCGGRTKNEAAFHSCATVDVLKLFGKALVKTPISYGELLDVGMMVFNAPRLGQCPVPEPPPGKPCQTCPGHTVIECSMLSELVNDVGELFHRIGRPVFIFGVAGVGSKLDKNFVPLLVDEYFTIGPMSTHLANFVAWRPSYATREDQSLAMTVDARELDIEFDSFHDDYDFTVDGHLIDYLHDSPLTRFVNKSLEDANPKALRMSLRKLRLGQEIEQLVTSSAVPDASTILSKFARNSKGTALATPQQHDLLDDISDAQLISAETYSYVKSILPPRRTRLDIMSFGQEIEQLVASGAEASVILAKFAQNSNGTALTAGAQYDLLDKLTLSAETHSYVESILPPRPMNTARLGQEVEQLVASGAEASIVLAKFAQNSNGTVVPIGRQHDLLDKLTLSAETHSYVESILPPRPMNTARLGQEIDQLVASGAEASVILAKFTQNSNGTVVPTGRQHAKLVNLLADEIISVESYNCIKPLLPELGQIRIINYQLIASECSNAIHEQALYPESGNTLQSVVDRLIKKYPGGGQRQRPLAEQRKILDTIQRMELLSPEEVAKVISYIPVYVPQAAARKTKRAKNKDLFAELGF